MSLDEMIDAIRFGLRCPVYMNVVRPEALEQLVDEIDRLRAALRPFAALHAEIIQCAAMCDETDPARDPALWFKGCRFDDLAAAAKALEATP